MQFDGSGDIRDRMGVDGDHNRDDVDVRGGEVDKLDILLGSELFGGGESGFVDGGFGAEDRIKIEEMM